MQTKHKAWLILGILALLVAVTPASWAQFNSNQPTVNFNALLGESLTVTASPGTVNFALATNGPAIGSAPIAITTADRKSTRLNSSHGYISYAVFCLKKKKRHRRHCRSQPQEKHIPCDH